MKYLDYAIASVIYHDGDAHLNMALKTWQSMPKGVPSYAVVNRWHTNKKEYPNNIKYIENDKNILARAWNIGLKEIFTKYDFAVVTNLDLEAPEEWEIEMMVKALKDNPGYGIVSATPMGMETFNTADGLADIKHGDGSFSLYIISKDAFNKVGDFDEGFVPAYFEDNDYLERMWQAGYKPQRFDGIVYYHITQGSMKHSTEVRKNYPVFMQKNLEYFKSKWGFVPPHLPADIKFN